MRRRATLLLLLAAFIGAAVAIRLVAGDWLEPRTLVALVKAYGASWWAMPALALAYLIGSTFFVPAVVFHVVAGASFGFAPAVAFNLAVANVVSNLQFWGGRLLGRERVKAWLVARGQVALVAELEDRGLWTMLVIRQLPLPFVGVNAAAGASPMPWWHFLVGSGLGLVPNGVVFTYFAAALVEGVEGARTEALVRALSAGAGIIALALVSRYLQTRRRRAAPLPAQRREGGA